MSRTTRARTGAGAKLGGGVALRREGEYWTVDSGGTVIRLKESKGLHYIDTLLRSPEVEFHAADLVGGAERQPGDKAAGAAAVREADLTSGGLSDAGELLDPQAKATYRQRVEDLRDELEEAERFGDPERAANAREELDFVSRELAAAVGLGGRDRRASSASERARVNVTRAIKSAISLIGEQDEELGRYFDATIHTGTFCTYTPIETGPARAGAPVDVPIRGELLERDRPLPAGTVTFLLTDIEGSTRLWEEDAEAMSAAVARSYALLDDAIASRGGVRPVEQGEGDSVVAAFPGASDALTAALDAQAALHAEAWPTEVVKLAAQGLTNPQIGERMFVSRATVKAHLARIFQKLDIHNRAELTAQAIRRGQ